MSLKRKPTREMARHVSGDGFHHTLPINNSHDFPPLPSQEPVKSLKSHQIPICESKPSETVKFASINDLPDELMLEILDYIPGIDLEQFQLATITSLSLTNRRFHKLVIPKLYGTFNSFFCTPYLFLRTVISNRQLANNVQSMRILYGPSVHAERKPYFATVSDRRIIKEGFKSLNIPMWKDWAARCNDNVDQETQYAAILMLTPNVVSLEVDDGKVDYSMPRWLDFMKSSVNRNTSDRLHGFAHLQAVQVDTGPLKIRHLAPLFRLPSVHEITLSSLVELDKWPEAKASALKRLIPAQCSSVKRLEIRGFVHVNIINVLIESARELTHLGLEHIRDTFLLTDDGEAEWNENNAFHSDDEGDAASIFNYPDMMPALLCHRDTLESAHFLHRDLDYSDYPDDIGLLQELRQFSSLKHVTAMAETFVNHNLDSPLTFVENLPSSLTSLEFVIEDFMVERIYSRIMWLMAMEARAHVPNLRNVLVRPSFRIKADWKSVQRRFAFEGITLTVDPDLNNVDCGSEDMGGGSSSDETMSSSGFEAALWSDSE